MRKGRKLRPEGRCGERKKIYRKGRTEGKS